jgi:predicted Zn finger-like uncharacterized protein
MIILCEGCAAKYFLPDEKMPSKRTRVRCPQCKAVFTLIPQHENVVAGHEDTVVTSAAELADSAAVSQETASTSAGGPAIGPDDASGGQFVRSPGGEIEIEPATKTAPSSTAGAKKGTKPSARRRSAGRDKDGDRARRLARVLVSDILCYNQEKRDQALADGNLMTVLGDEIKKSWELYKEKVGPEVAKSTNYFKEALNEILADGQKVF